MNQLDKHEARGDQTPLAARIIWSRDGGPIRHILNGRKRVPTGFFISRKMNGRRIPWESKRCELPMIGIAEVSTAVRRFMSQPHRLEMHVEGESRKWIYFPDLYLEVDAEFLQALDPNLPFGCQLLEWRPSPDRSRSYSRLVIELKDERDERLLDIRYMEKLRLASNVYGKARIPFHTVFRRKDVDPVRIKLVERVTADAFVEVNDTDRHKVRTLLENRARCTVSELADHFGGGAAARAKLHALHVQRVISLDMKGLHPDSTVTLCSLGLVDASV